MANGNPPRRPLSYDKKIGLVLPGGGALGSYQAGVFEALASSEYLPDCVAGISIGAINAAISSPLRAASTMTRRLGTRPIYSRILFGLCRQLARRSPQDRRPTPTPPIWLPAFHVWTRTAAPPIDPTTPSAGR